MNNELIINVRENELGVALMEDKKLVEYHIDTSSSRFAVGNIYLAKVKKILPALNAVFVDVGHDRSAFLHYQDLGINYNTLFAFTRAALNRRGGPGAPVGFNEVCPPLEKRGDIKNTIAVGQEVLVQIAKEPISTKGPRLTSEISFAGRFLVLMPFADKVFISQKIRSNAEKKRIKAILAKIRPAGFGVIVRTMAEGKGEEEFGRELDELIGKWNNVVKGISREGLPKLLHQEADVVTNILRDSLSPSYDSIVVNQEEEYEQIKEYVRQIAPEKENIVELYTGNLPVFDYYGVTRQLKSSFGRMVNFKNSAYLVIDHAEALHVIDVNSGNRSKVGMDQEMSALEVNLAAADEIARQLRLRDVGGIIVIDFIDVMKGENRQAIYDRMKENMSRDKARHNILPLSKFCLMQITRQRVRPVTKVKTEEVCPTCLGTGKAKPSLLFEQELEEAIRKMAEENGVEKFRLYVHPYVYAYVTKGWFMTSLKWQWRRKYGKFDVYPDESLGMLQYRFSDSDGEEIDLTELDNVKDDAEAVD